MIMIAKMAETNPKMKLDDIKAVLVTCQDKGKGKELCEAGKLIDECIKAELVSASISFSFLLTLL